MKHFALIAGALTLAVILGGCERAPQQQASDNQPVVARQPAASIDSPVSAPPSNAPAAAAPTGYSYAGMVERTAPSVVTIRSARRGRPPRQYPFMDDPFFRQFFGGREPQRPPERTLLGLGSGVIFDKDGHVLTNHHVIDGAEEISVETLDGRSMTAKLVGSDPPSDLAVLRVDGRDLPALSLGNSDDVRVGDVALAIGNPLGIGQTVTAGIISAKGRATGLSDGSFEDFLQTDAAINQGNSGGALVNAAGMLIGINSQILSPSGGNIGIGFAIPSNMAREVADQLIRNGVVRRGMLGVTIQSRPGAANRSSAGVEITAVAPGGPAERAGLRAGDLVTAFNGTPVYDSNTLRNRIARTAPGTEVTLKVRRGGQDVNLTARLAELRLEQQRQEPR